MLKLGPDAALIDKLGALAAHVVEEALASGLTWDQAITAFGVATKAIAAQAASQGNGTLEQCTAHAQQRLQVGMEQSADVLKAWLR
jgi:alkylation response protein AidB-like acyl-CoA dehydrogenase